MDEAAGGCIGIIVGFAIVVAVIFWIFWFVAYLIYTFALWLTSLIDSSPAYFYVTSIMFFAICILLVFQEKNIRGKEKIKENIKGDLSSKWKK